MNLFKTTLAAAAALCASVAFAGPITTQSTSGTALATALGGSGISISNAVLSGNTQAGTFTNGTSTVGFDSGVVLTTGALSCVNGPNTSGACTGSGNTSSLSFDFSSATGSVFFQYVFASEEYNEYVNSTYNDKFELLLNGVNIALLPNSNTVVSINTVNCNSNSAYYRNNSNSAAPSGCTNLGLDTQFDGLTTILTATANVTAGSTNTFEFKVSDVGDSSLDSAVFIKAGSFSGSNDVPEPASLALVGLGLLGAAAARRRKA